MEILEISLEAPSNFSGGGIGIKQSILSLCKIGNVSYIGPGIEKKHFNYSEIKNFNILHELDYSNNFIERIFGFVHGTLSGYYNSWKKYISHINWKNYDLVHIEFSKYHFLIEDVKRNTTVPVYVRVHNVETDYYKNLYNNKKNISSLLKYLFYKKEEKKTLEETENIICLTEKDKDRIIELFGIQNNNVDINPVCVEDSYIKNMSIKKKSNRLLMTGSLWYGPNADGIKWFVTDVFPILRNRIQDFDVIVAGSNPEKELKRLCAENNINIIKNPSNMEMIFRESDVYIAPVFSGAGMKVKIAEALMYGLPVVATNHALIGYEYSDVNSIIECHTAVEFANAIYEILKMDTDRYVSCCKKNRDLYLDKYSIESSALFYLNLSMKEGMENEAISSNNSCKL